MASLKWLQEFTPGYNFNNFCLSLMNALLNSCVIEAVEASHSEQAVVQAIRFRELHRPLPFGAGAQA
jgi:hypothetical protein